MKELVVTLLIKELVVTILMKMKCFIWLTIYKFQLKTNGK